MWRLGNLGSQLQQITRDVLTEAVEDEDEDGYGDPGENNDGYEDEINNEAPNNGIRNAHPAEKAEPSSSIEAHEWKEKFAALEADFERYRRENYEQRLQVVTMKLKSVTEERDKFEEQCKDKQDALDRKEKECIAVDAERLATVERLSEVETKYEDVSSELKNIRTAFEEKSRDVLSLQSENASLKDQAMSLIGDDDNDVNQKLIAENMKLHVLNSDLQRSQLEVEKQLSSRVAQNMQVVKSLDDQKAEWDSLKKKFETERTQVENLVIKNRDLQEKLEAKTKAKELQRQKSVQDVMDLVKKDILGTKSRLDHVLESFLELSRPDMGSLDGAEFVDFVNAAGNIVEIEETNEVISVTDLSKMSDSLKGCVDRVLTVLIDVFRLDAVLKALLLDEEGKYSTPGFKVSSLKRSKSPLIAPFEKDISSLWSSLVSTREAEKLLRGKLVKVEQERMNSLSDLESLRAEVVSARSSNQDLTRNLRKIEIESSSLQSELVQMRSEEEERISMIRSLETALQTAQRDVIARDRDISLLNESVNDTHARAQSDASAMRKEIHRLKESVARFEQQLHEAKLRTESRTRVSSSQVSDLQAQLHECEEELVILRSSEAQAQEAVTSLQSVLDSLTSERQNSTDLRVSELLDDNEQLCRDLSACKERNEQNSCDLETIRQEHELLKTEDSRRVREIRTLRLRNDEVERALQESLSQLRSVLTQNDGEMVDRRIVTQLIVKYFTRNKEKKDILELISKILGFSEEQQKAVGLIDSRGWFSFGMRGGGSGASMAPGNQRKQASLGDLWIKFLLEEAKGGSDKNDRSSTSASNLTNEKDVLVAKEKSVDNKSVAAAPSVSVLATDNNKDEQQEFENENDSDDVQKKGDPVT